MTDRVEEIKERVEKASAGPWTVSATGQSVHSEDREAMPKTVVVDRHINAENADFIANAPSDIRFLLSEIQRLRKVEEAAEFALAAIRADHRTIPEDRWSRHSVGTRLRNALSLSNTLEQQVPEPVREEMEG